MAAAAAIWWRGFRVAAGVARVRVSSGRGRRGGLNRRHGRPCGGPGKAGTDVKELCIECVPFSASGSAWREDAADAWVPRVSEKGDGLADFQRASAACARAVVS